MNVKTKSSFKLGTAGKVDMAFSTRNENTEEIACVIPGVMPKTVCSLVGKGGLGKGYLALGILFDLAIGNNTMGLSIKSAPEKTLFLSFEDMKEMIDKRVHSIAKIYSDDELKCTDEYVNAESHYGLENNETFLDRNGTPNQALINAISEECSGMRLIILDTLSRISGGIENDTDHMATLIKCFEQVALKTGAAVMFTHHTSKSADLAESSDANAARGAGSLTNNIRCQYNLNTMTEREAKAFGITNRKKYLKLTMSKSNYSEEHEPIFWLQRTEGGALVKFDPSAIKAQAELQKLNKGRKS